MVREEGGRWDVSIKENAVYLERVSQDDERLFDESLASDEARDLAELLTKFADKLDRSEKSKDPDDEDDDEDDDKDKDKDDKDKDDKDKD
ncbi:hypothetical protein [Mycobacterium sp. E3247]|uniref:hypothetical protein n=1 Tax=Mycobacterium sp. E3247 TaxID=1856864 RepID=UPI0008008521|nr:hypothetical protein [Mycobacterium sp. E3247]OBH00103.1 hypothetical protein A9X04_28745 [Mycobacterium sp. E3247]